MTDKIQQSSLEATKAYIDNIDFTMVVDKIVRTKNWKKGDVEKICQLYRQFLFLNKKYGQDYGQLPPSEEVDEFWHNHILDTKKYREETHIIFGKYLDHYPYFGIDGKSNEQDLQNAFDKIQQLHEKEFGQKIYRVRSLSVTEALKISFEIIRDFFRSKNK